MADDFYTMHEQLKSTSVHGRPPTKVAIFADTWQSQWPASMEHGGPLGLQVFDHRWNSAVDDFMSMLGLTCAECPETFGGGLNTSTGFSYGCGNKTVDTCFNPGAVDSDSRAIVWNLGDEIKLKKPEQALASLAPPRLHSPAQLQQFFHTTQVFENESAIDVAFRKWLKDDGVTPSQAGCGENFAGCTYNASVELIASNARLFYASRRYSDWFGVFRSAFYNTTQRLLANQHRTGRLPNAHTCANFPPGDVLVDHRRNRTRMRSWLPTVNMWIRGMRQGLFTLPFSEDYVFMSSCGSQQMFDLQVDASRAAIRPLDGLNAEGSDPLVVRSRPLRRLPAAATQPSRPMMQYVMSYDPGNTVDSQRRRFFGSIAHGLKWVHLYAFQSWPTSGGDPGPEVWQDRPGMYEAVRSETNVLGMFDDIVADGANAAQGAKAAILFSATADIYNEGYGTSGAAKR